MPDSPWTLIAGLTAGALIGALTMFVAIALYLRQPPR